ncbi:hypothetical protein Fmac_011511 [Flemingia macrophylla]|uniref:BRCT domain-containing protein n=1 Tax=Flemingia macrophylla TaxID=520843 RepID=A0ABD1MMP1_9FABA
MGNRRRLKIAAGVAAVVCNRRKDERHGDVSVPRFSLSCRAPSSVVHASPVKLIRLSCLLVLGLGTLRWKRSLWWGLGLGLGIRVRNCLWIRERSPRRCSRSFSWLDFCDRWNTLDSLEREEAEDLIKRHGGRVTGSVSKKTNFLLCDEDIGGRNSEKAKELGTSFLSEEGLFDMIRASKPAKASLQEDKKPVNKACYVASRSKVSSKSQVKVHLSSRSPSKQAKPKIATTVHSSLIWTVKHQPKDPKDIIGNQSLVTQLRNWLKTWNEQFLDTLLTKNREKSKTTGAKRAVLLCEPQPVLQHVALVSEVYGKKVDGCCESLRGFKLMRSFLDNLKLSGFNAGKLKMDERINLSMSDPDLVPLLVQENYINYRPSSAGKDDSGIKRMNMIARAAESIADADIVNVQIRRYRHDGSRDGYSNCRDFDIATVTVTVAATVTKSTSRQLT